MLENSEESLLNITREVIKATNSDSTSIEGDSSEAIVLTGEQHLEETTHNVNLSVENQKLEIRTKLALKLFSPCLYTYSWKERAPSLSESKNFTSWKSSPSVAEWLCWSLKK